jgi:hypothetical protein
VVRLREEAVRTALRLREQNLMRELEGAQWQLRQAREDGDMVALERYKIHTTETASSWNRAQKALRLRSALDVD